MSYEYDVFISYRRAGNAQKWVKDHFAPTLEDCLALELESEPNIYFDSKLEAAKSWPPELGHKLARSKMLITLWSKNYLHSDWCTMELAHMSAREEELGFRTPENPDGLIAVFLIHDGEELSDVLGDIQSVDIRGLYNTRMRPDSDKATELEDVLRDNAATLARIIELAPKFQSKWATLAANRFYDMYREKKIPSQDRPPTFSRR